MASSEPQSSSGLAEGAQRKRIEHRGTFSLQNKGFYFYILWPIVQVKNLVEILFDKIVEMIGSELMGDTPELSQAGHIFVFLFLSMFSVTMHTFQEYDDPILLVLLSIWCLDYILAKGAFQKGTGPGRVLLKSVKDNQIIWRMEGDDDVAQEARFKREELDKIFISRVRILGGSFQEAVGMNWRIELILKDSDTLLIDEEQVFRKAMQKAGDLASQLNIPLKFSHSEGRSELAQEASASGEANSNSRREKAPSAKIHTKEKQGKFEISSAWSLQNVGMLLNRMLRKSGFLLFVLIVTGVMIRFGGLLKFLVGRYIGLAAPPITIDLRFQSILAVFIPTTETIDLLEVSFAIAVMIFYGWRMS